MKDKLTQNISLKIAAFFCAVLLWILAVNVDDPVKSTTFRNIPVTVINEEVVTNKGKTYQIVGGVQTVNVTVYGRRSVLSDIDSSNVEATLDLSQMETNTFLVPVTANVKGLTSRDMESISRVEASPANLQVKIEDSIKATFPISISTTGTPRDGYVVGQMTTNPEKISIGGSESLVNNIARVVAKVNVSGMSADRVLPAELILYDGNGNVMDQSMLSNNLGEEGLSVNVQMLETKSVKLSFLLEDNTAEGYICTGWNFEPESIQVCGTEDVLKNLEEIEIPTSVLSLDGAVGKKEVTVDVLPYLPSGVRLVDENANNVLLTVNVEEIGVRTIELPLESIRINNLSDNLKVDFGTANSLVLRYSGAQEELDKIDIRNAVSIDLKNYSTEGAFAVPIQIEEIAAEVTLMESPKVTVMLSKKQSE